jgi:hypothetical protein
MIVALTMLTATAFSQTSATDADLLKKTRALYDAPFTRNLISFDCAVQFDWKQHLVDVLGSVPPAAAPTVGRLQSVKHRVFVDRSGTIVSSVPTAPDLSAAPKAKELEQVLNAMFSEGLNAWIPFSTNVILPVEPTKYHFEKTDTGYTLTLNGAGVAATLLLADDLRVVSGVSQLPQPMRFKTDFAAGPNGFVLASVVANDAKFAFSYAGVDGFQLPAKITVTPSTNEAWHYSLSGCKAARGVLVPLGLPKSNPPPASSPASPSTRPAAAPPAHRVPAS